MKKIVIGALVFAGMLAQDASAILKDNLDGTVTETKADGTRLMWLLDANLPGVAMTWPEASLWADSLEFAGHSDWRLPSAFNPGWAGPCSGYGCPGSELGYMYFQELKNPPFGPGYMEEINAGPFQNLAGYYWSGTSSAGDNSNVLDFNFDSGGQFTSPRHYTNNAWAVRAAVPEPGSLLLYAPAAGIFLITRRAGKEN